MKVKKKHFFQHITTNLKVNLHVKVVLRSEIPSGMYAKLRTMAACNNRDHASQSLFAYAGHHVQSFTRYYRQSFDITISLTLACSRYIYNGVILHAHPVRGESHNQRNATGEVATVVQIKIIEKGTDAW